MRKLRIEAASLSSARGFYDALRAYACELEENDSGYVSVDVPIRTDGDILGILEALKKHVTERMKCSASPVGPTASATEAGVPNRRNPHLFSQKRSVSWASE